MIDSKRMPGSNVTDDAFSSTGRKDVDSLLQLAEKLQERCDVMSRRIEQYRVMQILTLAVGFSLGASTFWLMRSEGSFTRIAALSAVLMSFIYAGTIEYLIWRVKRRSKPDGMALAEVVELLRETEGVIAEAENWSTLDRAEFRIRLSRFGIGYKDYKSYQSYTTR